MKTQWDYTELAEAYLSRPDYASEAVSAILEIAKAKPGDRVCDVGAGAAHLTIPLAAFGLTVTAVEPNDAMRAQGVRRTQGFPRVTWVEGVGEDTGQPGGAFSLVTFGSSFNVTDRQRALRETHRILMPSGWFACLWNHRDLGDPVQAAIEAVIRRHVPEYDPGTRRADQTEVIEASGLFTDVQPVTGRVVCVQDKAAVSAAWRSHATLKRQAGEAFEAVMRDIDAVLAEIGGGTLSIPYDTRAWVARRREG